MVLWAFGHMRTVKSRLGLHSDQHPEEDLQPILREEVEIAVAALKRGESAGVDNISAELVQAAGQTIIDVLSKACNKIWKTGERLNHRLSH